MSLGLDHSFIGSAFNSDSVGCRGMGLGASAMWPRHVLTDGGRIIPTASEDQIAHFHALIIVLTALQRCGKLTKGCISY